MLASGLLARTEVALVVYVHSVSNRVETAGAAEVFHDGEEFVLAVEAAGGIIVSVFRALEFGGGDDFQRDPVFLRESDRIVQMSAGEAG